ncbi:hypothetical protein KAR91_10685 [Candidatus Pacearchaeota archaeon]|nr:hypothetical protein [Candidatus Pacearchaeota archaeon]
MQLKEIHRLLVNKGKTIKWLHKQLGVSKTYFYICVKEQHKVRMEEIQEILSNPETTI